MSEQVERRLVDLLGNPTESPYGNPIPGLAELGQRVVEEDFLAGVQALAKIQLSDEPVRVVVRRIAEELQKDTAVMSVLRRVGALPGNDVLVSAGHDGVIIARQAETAELDRDAAAHLFVNA